MYICMHVYIKYINTYYIYAHIFTHLHINIYYMYIVIIFMRTISSSIHTQNKKNYNSPCHQSNV